MKVEAVKVEAVNVEAVKVEAVKVRTGAGRMAVRKGLARGLSGGRLAANAAPPSQGGRGRGVGGCKRREGGYEHWRAN